MTAHDTDAAPDIARGAQERDRDIAVTLAENTQSDTLSEGDAAGPPLTWALIARGLLIHCWLAYDAWRERERLRMFLHDLSERELLDIGVTPGEIECIVANRRLDELRDGTNDLWLR